MAKRTSTVMIVITALLLSACNFPLFSGTDEEETDAMATAVAETVQALNSQPGVQDQQTDDPLAGLPTVTPLATDTPVVVEGPPAATPLPCNKAVFVSETIPDDTEFASGEAFTKSWTFVNKGTCTWNTNYKLVFTSGDQMDGPDSVNLTASVVPDGQVTVSVDMTAPEEPGTYTGYWKVQAEDNEQFGQVYVRIKTETVFFQVTSVTYSMADTSIEAECDVAVAISGEITTSAAGKVTYYWTNSAGGQSSTKQLTFDAAETKTVEYTMTVDASGDYWVKLYIDTPNHQLFAPKNFSVTCTTP